MEKKPLYIHKRFREQRQKVIESLKESGNVSFACKRAGISRDTYYRWRKISEKFKEETDSAILSGKEFVNDLAHNQLIRNIQNGDMGAIKFQLGNCHDDYLPKKSVQAIRFADTRREISVTSIPVLVRFDQFREFVESGGDPDEWVWR